MRPFKLIGIPYIALIAFTSVQAQNLPAVHRSASSELLVSPLSLSFESAVQGNAPAPQSISIISANGSPVSFVVQTDSGTGGQAAGPWLTVNPMAGTTPGRLSVRVDQSALAPGSYTARIRISSRDNQSSGSPTDVAVSLIVRDVNPQLSVAPTIVRVAGDKSDAAIEQDLLVSNSGGRGPIPFTATVADAGPLQIEVTPQASQTAVNATVSVHLKVLTSQLAPGSYRTLIHLSSPANSVDVPVSIFVSEARPVLGLNFVGIRFDAREAGGGAQTRNANVLNNGAPGTTVRWTAEVLSGNEWLELGANSGSATQDTPSRLPLSISDNASTLPAGAYYALVKVSAPDSLNSPQFLVAVLNLATASSPPKPDPAPQGLFFTAVAGGPKPASQPIRVFTSSMEPVPFQAAVSTEDGGSWLEVNGANAITGQTSTDDVTTLAVTVNTAGLKPGVYTGDVNIAMAGYLRTTNITLVLQSSGQTSASASNRRASNPPAAEGCKPGRLSLTQTGLVNNFSVPAGWPSQLLVRLADDCGDPVLNAQMVAVFDNGDSPRTMQLTNTQIGLYSTTWAPGTPGAQVAITATATAPNFPPASALISGNVTPNLVPVLNASGILNTLNPVAGAPLAPGSAAQLFGSNLAAAAVVPGLVPLPTTFNRTTVIVGGIEAPLYFLSDGQINVQLPTQLNPTQQYQVVVDVNGALTLPDTIGIVQVGPGLAEFADGNVIAQHADYSLVDAAHPAVPGEGLILYLVGMGATNPAVNAGAPGPTAEPLARVTIQPTVTIGGRTAAISFAGLAPGGIGNYQINCVVPTGIQSGEVDVVVVQSGATSNTAKLRVR